MLCGSVEAFTARLHALGLSGHIQTAFIERVHLTLRCSLAPLARHSWCTAQLPGELTLQLKWWRAYYHFVQPHQALRQRLDQPRSRGGRRLAQLSVACTPATLAPRCARRRAGVAIGLIQWPWSVLEVLSFPLPNS